MRSRATTTLVCAAAAILAGRPLRAVAAATAAAPPPAAEHPPTPEAPARELDGRTPLQPGRRLGRSSSSSSSEDRGGWHGDGFGVGGMPGPHHRGHGGGWGLSHAGHLPPPHGGHHEGHHRGHHGGHHAGHRGGHRGAPTKYHGPPPKGGGWTWVQYVTGPAIWRSSSSSSSEDWIPDAHSPGICAPNRRQGGLRCDADEDDWDYCTSPGERAECGRGRACYDKRLCPRFGHDQPPVGVCEMAPGTGLACDEVTTYCSAPGRYAECGEGRKCYAATLCGFGSHGHDGGHAGVCGLPAASGDERRGLDCAAATTQCTAPGAHAECAYGGLCFDAALCHHHNGGHAGFCAGDGYDCDRIFSPSSGTTWCAIPGAGGQCPPGQACRDAAVCDPTAVPTRTPTPPPTSRPTSLGLGETCFVRGKVVDCDRWAADGWGDGHGGGGGAEWLHDGHADDGGDGGGQGGGSGWLDDGHSGGDGGWLADGHDGECVVGSPNACDAASFCLASAPGSCHGRGACVPAPEACTQEYSPVCGCDGATHPNACAAHAAGASVAYAGECGDGVLHVPFTYTVDTDGETAPGAAVRPVENAILDDVAAHVEANEEEFGSFTGRITASPPDYLADDEYCGDGEAVRCSVVKGEMTFFIDESTPSILADACAAADLIEDSMKDQDYAEDVAGVTDVEYRGSPACARIVGGAAAVVAPADDGISAAAFFGLLFAAAALAALALLAARRLRRRSKEDGTARDLPEDFSLISNDLDGDFFERKQEDPRASTVDVHTCKSIYCNCNKDKALSGTTFLPVDCRKVDLASVVAAQGISPTGVDAADGPSFGGRDSRASGSLGEASAASRDTILRVPIRAQMEPDHEDGGPAPLSPVSEIAHDSQIDSELDESVGDIETVIPPPPPLESHPAYPDPERWEATRRSDSDDEMSV